MVESARKRDTRAELDALPEGVVGELIEGVLYTFPRRRRVAEAASRATPKFKRRGARCCSTIGRG